MTNSIEEYFDIEQYDQDDDEQNFEEEAKEMLKLWDRSQLMREVAEEREKIKSDNEKKEIVYYNGEEFDPLKSDMTQLGEGENVWFKLLEANPEGRQVRALSTILFDYVGFMELEENPFESTIYDGAPKKLNLAEGPIIPGLLLGLINMREGERASILIHPNMAYGELGCLPLIGSHEYLFYNVKILKVWDESELDLLIDGERDLNLIVPEEEKIAIIEKQKEVANTFLRDGHPKEAAVRYKAAIYCMEDMPTRFHFSKLFQTLLQNISIAYNHLKMYNSATQAAKRALFIDSSSTKAYYQLAKARIGKGDYSGALKWIDKASKIVSNNDGFDLLRLEIDAHLRTERIKRDEIMIKMSRAYK